MTNLMTSVMHVVDSCHGIDSARYFAEHYGETIREQCPDLAQDIDELLAGPEGNSWYFDAWDRVLAEGSITDLRTGERWVPYESEGIYLALDTLEWCHGCDWFRGPECGNCIE